MIIDKCKTSGTRINNCVNIKYKVVSAISGSETILMLSTFVCSCNTEDSKYILVGGHSPTCLTMPLSLRQWHSKLWRHCVRQRSQARPVAMCRFHTSSSQIGDVSTLQHVLSPQQRLQWQGECCQPTGNNIMYVFILLSNDVCVVNLNT